MSCIWCLILSNHHVSIGMKLSCACCPDYNRANFELHNPYERILQRQFVNYLVILAYQIYGEEFS